MWRDAVVYDPARIHLQALLLILAVVWGLLLLLQGVAVTPAFFKPFSMVVGIGVALLSAFDLFLLGLGSCDQRRATAMRRCGRSDGVDRRLLVW